MSAKDGNGRDPLLIVLLLLAAALVAGGVAFVALRSSKAPDGPVEVVWDREPCAHCRMLVGEPGFAAQLQTLSGDVFFYDDPGCLMLHRDSLRAEVHAIYFHHLKEERWIALEDAGFVPVPVTPMGFGLGAVDADTPGSVPYPQARTRARARVSASPGPAGGA